MIMIWYTIKVTIISLLIIILGHHLFDILKNSLTHEKIIDCVKKPQEEYDKIYDILSKNDPSKNNPLSIVEQIDHNIHVQEKMIIKEEDMINDLTKHLLDL